MEVKKKKTTKLRDYLNSEESSNFLFLKITAIHLRKYIEKWETYGNITAEEHKNIKMTETYLNKFVNTMESRLSAKQNETLNKKKFKYAIKILDQYTLDRLQGTLGNDYEIVHLKRNEFEDIFVPETMDGMCKNCKKNYEDCSWHDFMLENFVPESDEMLPNCRYAYTREFKSERYKDTISKTTEKLIFDLNLDQSKEEIIKATLSEILSRNF